MLVVDFPECISAPPSSGIASRSQLIQRLIRDPTPGIDSFNASFLGGMTTAAGEKSIKLSPDSSVPLSLVLSEAERS